MHSGNEVGPACRCGKRGTCRVGDSGLLRICQHCGETYAYRFADGALLPFPIETALALDEARRMRRGE